jgi:hypothetical protein
LALNTILLAAKYCFLLLIFKVPLILDNRKIYIPKYYQNSIAMTLGTALVSSVQSLPLSASVDIVAAGDHGYKRSYQNYNLDEDDVDRRKNSRSTHNTEYDEPLQRGYTPKSSLDGVLGLFKNQKQLGAILLGIGMLLTFMGMMLFFEGNLLRLGNICTILGIPLLIGPSRVKSFFLKESRIQASVITSLGILLVFTGRPRLGILLEIFGLLNLFGNMLPFLLVLAKKLPIIGDVISSFDGDAPKQRYGNNNFPQF